MKLFVSTERCRPAAAKRGVRKRPMSMWKRSILASLLVAFLVAFPYVFLGVNYSDYSPGVSWEDVKALPHQQAIDLMQSRAIKVNAMETFQRNIGDSWVWQYFLLHWAAFAIMCFAACGLAHWRRRPV